MSVLVGNKVRVQAVFKDEHGEVQDPATVTVHTKDPDDNVETYVYGTDDEVKRASKGQYYIEIDTTGNIGDWQFIWNSTGTYQAAGQTSFTVAAALFAVPAV
jgi:hypothetical protein